LLAPARFFTGSKRRNERGEERRRRFGWEREIGFLRSESNGPQRRRGGYK
jgi:hypothetical protein